MLDKRKYDNVMCQLVNFVNTNILYPLQKYTMLNSSKIEIIKKLILYNTYRLNN